MFSQAGEVISCHLIKDRHNDQWRGFGFVEMASDEAAQQAISWFDGYQIRGRRLIARAASRESTNDGGAHAGSRSR